MVQPTLISKIRQMQCSDKVLVSHINDLIVDLLDECPMEWPIDLEGSLCFKGRFCVPDNAELEKEVRSKGLQSQCTIHLSGTNMYHDLKHTFWYEGMKKEYG